MSVGYKPSLERYELEANEEWNKWCKEIPFIALPAGVKFKVLPPFHGAIVRFKAEYEGKTVSVYLDCYDKLGSFGSPYWELYPYRDDVYRCPIDDADDLVLKICEALGFNTNDK